MYIPRDCRRRQRAAHSDQDRQRVVLKQPKHDPGHAEQLRILRNIRFPVTRRLVRRRWFVFFLLISLNQQHGLF